MKSVFLAALLLLNAYIAFGQQMPTKKAGEETIILSDSTLRYGRTVYYNLDIEPLYPGGPEAFNLFVKKNLKYPPKALEHKTEGRVTVRFIIEKSGRLSHVAIARDIGDGCGEEAVRLIKKSRKWISGRIRDYPVRTQISMGVIFIMPHQTG